MTSQTAGATAGGRAWSAAGALPAGLFLPALLLLFTLSGVSGLIYEVVWLRYLTLVFGVTVYAVSTVLTVFMGGLALGGFLAGKFADRLQRPLRAYGVIELLIAASAILTPTSFALLHGVYGALYPVAAGEPDPRLPGPLRPRLHHAAHPHHPDGDDPAHRGALLAGPQPLPGDERQPALRLQYRRGHPGGLPRRVRAHREHRGARHHPHRGGPQRRRGDRGDPDRPHPAPGVRGRPGHRPGIPGRPGRPDPPALSPGHALAAGRLLRLRADLPGLPGDLDPHPGHLLRGHHLRLQPHPVHLPARPGHRLLPDRHRDQPARQLAPDRRRAGGGHRRDGRALLRGHRAPARPGRAP